MKRHSYKCSSCGYRIPFYRFKCKYCRNTRWHLRHYLFYGALTLVVIVSVLVYLDSRSSQPPQPTAPKPKSGGSVPTM